MAKQKVLIQNLLRPIQHLIKLDKDATLAEKMEESRFLAYTIGALGYIVTSVCISTKTGSISQLIM